MIEMFDIKKIQEEKIPVIENELRKVFSEHGIPNLDDAVCYHIGTGGKMIRPILGIMSYEALGGKDMKILPFACACEILHQWLLIHDDIEDGDRVRRNKPAVWIKYGLGHGINIGDYMAQKVYEMILRSDKYGVDEKTINKLIKIMVQVSVKTSEGQAMDMNLRNNNNPSEEEYMKMVTGKTAHYLTVPIIGSAIVSGHEELIDKIIEFGSYAGPAFQIRDDVLDLTEGKGRNEIGRDIKEGKRSILVVHCLPKCSEEEKEKLLEILNKSVENTTNKDVKYAKSLFEKYGSIGYASKKSEELIEKAKNTAKQMPDKLREVLEFFGDYLIKRVK